MVCSDPECDFASLILSFRNCPKCSGLGIERILKIAKVDDNGKITE